MKKGNEIQTSQRECFFIVYPVVPDLRITDTVQSCLKFITVSICEIFTISKYSDIATKLLILVSFLANKWKTESRYYKTCISAPFSTSKLTSALFCAFAARDSDVSFWKFLETAFISASRSIRNRTRSLCSFSTANISAGR